MTSVSRTFCFRNSILFRGRSTLIEGDVTGLATLGAVRIVHWYCDARVEHSVPFDVAAVQALDDSDLLGVLEELFVAFPDWDVAASHDALARRGGAIRSTI